MANAKIGSRTGRRQSTKSPMRRQCQNATAGVVRRAQKPLVTRKKHPAYNMPTVAEFAQKEDEIEYPFFTVVHKRTKKSITISASSPEEAMRMAVEPPHRLAKSVDKLTIEEFGEEE